MRQRSFDRHRYKNRNLIERFFSRIKQFKRIATRYDKSPSPFCRLFISLALSFGWID